MNIKDVIKAGHSIPSKGLGVYKHNSESFKLIEFDRKPVGEKDIVIKTLYAGICHSDIHTAYGHWGGFPEGFDYLIPGHEIVGKIIGIGDKVTKHKVGDIIGIGCMVDSCGQCCACEHNVEFLCKDCVLTYGSKDKEGNLTQGGYSNSYVLNEDFAIKIPRGAILEKAPSLMCAGITTFSPIRRANVKDSDLCCVLGLGGLGHMACKYLKALGCEVIAIDTKDKEKFAQKLGIKFAQIEDKLDKSFYCKFDFVISTIPYEYDLNDYLQLVKPGGDFAIVGLPPYEECPDVNLKDMILKYPGVKIWGSQIGGIEETQLCVDFSVNHGIYPDIEKIEPTVEAIQEAYKRMLDGDIDGRFVIDIEKLNDSKKGVEFAEKGTKLNKNKYGYPDDIASDEDFMSFIESLSQNAPNQQPYTQNYNTYRAWQLNGMPENFEQAIDRNMYMLDDKDGMYHALSAYINEDGNYEFMKSPDHPTRWMELDWYDNGPKREKKDTDETLDAKWNDWLNFRRNYVFKEADENTPAMYIQKQTGVVLPEVEVKPSSRD